MTRSAMITVHCDCGEPVRLRAYTCIDLAEEPRLLEEIDKGCLHNSPCLHCGKRVQIDKWFLLQDSKREILIHVFPMEYRPMYAELLQQLDPLHRLCGIDAVRSVKLVFGMVDLLAFIRGEPTHLPPVLFSHPGDRSVHATVH